MQALSQSDLDEMRHYRMPPDGVVMVMDLICMLFNHPCGWESSRQLLMQSSFFQVKKTKPTEPNIVLDLSKCFSLYTPPGSGIFRLL